MRIRQVVFIGPHGAGKTTLGSRLAKRLGWRFDREIGGELREKRLSVDPNAHALAPQEEFDSEVLEAELARDATAEGPRVVETWHPGNFAYALLRSPAVAERYRSRLAEACAACRSVTLVQPLGFGVEATAVQRLREPGPSAAALTALFRRVGDDSARVAEAWGLSLAPRIDTDLEPVEECLERILEALERAG